ncbi:MAG: SGNH/GDSL hydrolase family protein [Arenicella sp.]
MQTIRSIFIAVCLFILASCGGGGSSSDSAGNRVTKVVAIGDSIGAGFGGVNPWPVLLGEKLGVLVVNNSISGRQVVGGASVVRALLETEQPSHLVVLLGSNDARNGSVSSAVSNMNFIVQAAVEAGVVPIIGTVPPNFESSTFNADGAQISASYRGIGGAVIANVREAFGNNAAFFQDGLHPNNDGQELIAQTFRDAF